MLQVTDRDIALMIDHSLLNPTYTARQVAEGCELARRHEVASVCVKPCHVALAARVLAGSAVAVGTVIGFPHGNSTAAVKVFEAEQALNAGAAEIDMVLNIGALLGGEHEFVEDEIRAVARVTHARGGLVKVIFENAYLTDEQKIAACRISTAAGADWVKTSTGYAPSGATVHDLRLMREHAGPRVQIKAAGGVRTLRAALAVRALGGTRFGCTRTAEMLDEARRTGPLSLPDPATLPEPGDMSEL